MHPLTLYDSALAEHARRSAEIDRNHARRAREGAPAPTPRRSAPATRGVTVRRGLTRAGLRRRRTARPVARPAAPRPAADGCAVPA